MIRLITKIWLCFDKGCFGRQARRVFPLRGFGGSLVAFATPVSGLLGPRYDRTARRSHWVRVLLVHSLFDVLALIAALAVFRLVPVAAPGVPNEPWQIHPLYIAAASLGATAGAYLAGTANLWLT